MVFYARGHTFRYIAPVRAKMLLNPLRDLEELHSYFSLPWCFMPGSHIPVYCSRTHQNAAESTNTLGIGERFSGILARTGANIPERVTPALL